MILLPFCCSLFTQLYPAASASACDLRGKIRAKSKRAKAILMSFVIRASGAGCSGKWTRTSPRRSGWCTQCRSWLWSVRRMILSGNSLLSTTPGGRGCVFACLVVVLQHWKMVNITTLVWPRVRRLGQAPAHTLSEEADENGACP